MPPGLLLQLAPSGAKNLKKPSALHSCLTLGHSLLCILTRDASDRDYPRADATGRFR